MPSLSLSLLSSITCAHGYRCDVVGAIRAVLRGASYLSPLIARETVAFLLEQPKDGDEEAPLTGRQGEILQLLAEGRSMKEVASILNISPGYSGVP